MSPENNLLEPLSIAVHCLCAEGSLLHRLENATTSVLAHLDGDEISGLHDAVFSEDLKFVISWTRANMVQGVFQREPTADERAKLVEKILSLHNRCLTRG
jgi:hypothetical protein